MAKDSLLFRPFGRLIGDTSAVKVCLNRDGLNPNGLRQVALTDGARILHQLSAASATHAGIFYQQFAPVLVLLNS